MSDVISAEAPGKLVVAGEYAVLAGGPGIAVAVDVPARARITPARAGGSALVVPGTGERFGFRWIAGSAPRWEAEVPGALGLPLEAVVVTLYTRGLLTRAGDLPDCLIELDTAPFTAPDPQGQRRKLGLGSSAAVVVALTGALLRHIGGPRPEQAELLAACCEAHRRLQGGGGSGLDVATSLTGGVIAAEFPASGVPQVQPLAWPDRLHMAAVWTGFSASTPALLQRLRRWQERSPSAAASQMARLCGAAARVRAAWNGPIPALLGAFADFARGLEMLDELADIGIWSREHQELAELARQEGLVYKPSGAGGGDFGLAFADSAGALAGFRSAAAAAGYRCLDAELCAPGLGVTGGAMRGRPVPPVRNRPF